ncbi:ATP-binding cassette domain-containing protein [Bacteriovoracales bacterium]|nr:ATP-binding cassette domain-containing protein [Bacteriovoracales bacterium]
MNDFVLKCENLSIGYNEVLKKDLSIKLKPREILLLKGENGSGKSTLLKTLLSELKKKKGSYSWKYPLKSISYLPQINKESQSIHYTIKDILEIYNIPSSNRHFISQKLYNSPWENLSGGEKQKVRIASRLTKDVKVLILDEPFNHVDKNATSEITSFLSDLVETGKLSALVVVTHKEINFGKTPVVKVEL